MKKSVAHVYAIPTIANMIVMIVCSVLYFVLLKAASDSGSLAGMIAYGFLFAFIINHHYTNFDS